MKHEIHNKITKKAIHKAISNLQSVMPEHVCPNGVRKKQGDAIRAAILFLRDIEKFYFEEDLVNDNNDQNT